MDFLPICLALILFMQILLVLGVWWALRRLDRALHADLVRVYATLDVFREKFSMDDQIRKNREAMKNPSTDLQEFLSDLRIHGAGILRISPDAVFLRTVKS